MNKNNMRFSAGGLLLVIFAILNMIMTLVPIAMQLRYLGNGSKFWHMFGATAMGVAVTAVILIVIGCILLAKRPGLPITITAGLAAVYWLFVVVRYLTVATMPVRLIPIYAGTSLACALVFISMVLLSLPHVTKSMNGVKKLWFLPGVLYILYVVLGIVQTTILNRIGVGMSAAVTVSTILSTIFDLFIEIPMAVAFFLAGRWMANPWKKQPAYAPQPGYAAPAQNPNIQAQLAYYEQLYRNGQITEQAYLNIRKQLTGR